MSVHHQKTMGSNSFLGQVFINFPDRHSYTAVYPLQTDVNHTAVAGSLEIEVINHSITATNGQAPQKPADDASQPGEPGAQLIDAANQKKGKRELVAREILSSEQSYVTSLQALSAHFIDPLQASATSRQPIVSMEEHQILFKNMTSILHLNLGFLESLGECIRGWNDSSTLGDLFIRFSPFFKLYTVYVNNYDRALKLAQSLQEKSKGFRKVHAPCVCLPVTMLAR